MSPADRATPQAAYVRLPGQYRGFLRQHSLYMGDDHLLLVDSSRFSETYKRFYLRDIQTIIVRKAPRLVIPYYWIVIAVAALIALLIGLRPFRSLLFWPSVAIIAGIAVYLYLASMFQSCTCHLITRVTRTELPSLFRLRTAQQFNAAVTPRIVAAQGQLPADWIERSTTLEELATADEANPEIPVDLLPASTGFNWAAVTAFALVLADAGITTAQLRAADSGVLGMSNMVNLIALAVCSTLAIVRLTRQGGSKLLRGFVLGGLLLVAGVTYGSAMLQSVDQQIYHETYRNAMRYAGMRQLAIFEVIADVAVALPGLLLAFRRGKGARP